MPLDQPDRAVPSRATRSAASANDEASAVGSRTENQWNLAATTYYGELLALADDEASEMAARSQHDNMPAT